MPQQMPQPWPPHAAPWPSPAPQWAPQAPPKNVAATVSYWCAVVSILIWPVGIAAIVAGVIAKQNAARTGVKAKGVTEAIIFGVITSLFGLYMLAK